MSVKIIFERYPIGTSLFFVRILRMNKIIFLSAIIFLLSNLINAENASADIFMVSNSAEVKIKGDKILFDEREIKLKNFLEGHKSPLAPYAGVFIKYADEYDLDWRLVPSISGVESTFGKRIPKGSYNAYGWANGEYRFESWESSIEHVSKTLREKYYDMGANDIDKIARRYAPPSKTWGRNVKFFMNKIDSTPVEFEL